MLAVVRQHGIQVVSGGVGTVAVEKFFHGFSKCAGLHCNALTSRASRWNHIRDFFSLPVTVDWCRALPLPVLHSLLRGIATVTATDRQYPVPFGGELHHRGLPLTGVAPDSIASASLSLSVNYLISIWHRTDCIGFKSTCQQPYKLVGYCLEQGWFLCLLLVGIPRELHGLQGAERGSGGVGMD